MYKSQVLTEHYQIIFKDRIRPSLNPALKVVFRFFLQTCIDKILVFHQPLGYHEPHQERQSDDCDIPCGEHFTEL